MAKLAIKGHAIRGKEVIKTLEMLGGKQGYEICTGSDTGYHWYIKDNGLITCNYSAYKNDCVEYTLEEFLQEFPYKVGDKVKCWINGYCGIHNIRDIQWDSIVNEVKYKIGDYWYSTMNLQSYKEEVMENKPNLLQQLKEYFENTPREVIEKEWHEYDKYNDISPKVNEYLEYVNNIRQPKYPKTYEECHKLMVQWKEYDCNPNSELILCEAPIHDFCKLIVARNIYWKIAGEQMGLGKPWEPDYSEDSYEQGSPIKYVIYYTGTYITKGQKCTPSCILAFPTAEMRDAFYENFKELIEECKELI